jgi:tetratricopeptide (TPR) repeat protein
MLDMKKQLAILIIILWTSITRAQDNTVKYDELYRKGIEYFNNHDLQNAKNAFEKSFETTPNFNAYGMYVIITLSSRNASGLSENNKTLAFTLKLKEFNKIKNGYFFNILDDSYLQVEKLKLNSNRDDKLQFVESNIKKNIDKNYINNPNDFSTNLNKGISLIGFFPEIYKSKLDNSYQILPQGLNPLEAYKSKEYFDNLTKIKPESETGYFFRGFINSVTDNNNDAISDFRHVLKLNSKNVFNNILLADLLKENDFSGYVDNLNRVFEVKPNEVVESIKIDGSELDMLFYYALFYKDIVQSGKKIENVLTKLMYEKKYSDLDILCNEFTIKNKSNSKIKEKVLYYKGIANFNQGSFYNAIDVFNSIIKLNPSISDAYGMRGASNAMINENESAILDLNKAIELEPNDGYMYFYRGIVNKKLGKTDESCSDFNKSRELGYENQKLMFFFENCK